jgi:formylmethanofuran dehydrogenase subunit B
MPDEGNAGRRRNTGCPFCGLVCDDLTIEEEGGRLRVVEAGCAISRKRFEALDAAASPMVSGRPAELAAAVARAATILGDSRAPLFVVAADVAGTRVALRLADRLGGVIDHPRSAGLFRALRPLQDAGALTTTLGEIRNRADLVLIVGPDPSPVLPRFFERCLAPTAVPFDTEPLRREVVRLGPPEPAAGDAKTITVAELPCPIEQLPDAIAVLAMIARGASTPSTPAGVDQGRLAALADRLKVARYVSVLWTPPLLAMEGAELLAQALLELARTLTRTTRCVVLPLGGGGNLFGVNQVALWQSGYPIRTAFGAGVPEHDPYRFSADRMLADGEADALVWASSLDERPPSSAVPTVLLAPPGAAEAAAAAVYIPVGVPGVDHPGQVFRTDGVVAMHLAAVRRTALPDLGSVLEQIEGRLAVGGRAA